MAKCWFFNPCDWKPLTQKWIPVRKNKSAYSDGYFEMLVPSGCKKCGNRRGIQHQATGLLTNYRFTENEIMEWPDFKAKYLDMKDSPQ